MKRKMIYRNAIAAVALVCAGAFTAACKDWDDHYDATPSIGESNITLWENIKNNHPELSSFATLLEKAGYDSLLSTSQSFTVWAPVNSELNFDSLNALSLDTLRNEFIKNHVARSNFVASGNINESVFMLSGKVLSFKLGEGGYTMDNVPVAAVNIANKNGVMHTLAHPLSYLKNIYESLNTHSGPIGSFSDYFHSFDDSTFLPSRSVVGPIVDGQITYLDSVFNATNDLFMHMSSIKDGFFLDGGGSYINREDSSYTMLVPTDVAWDSGRESISKYFHYVSDFVFDDVTETGKTSETRDSIKFNADSLSELTVQNLMMSNLIYNNHNYLNTRLVDLKPGEKFNEGDSIVSSYCQVLYKEDADYLFDGAKRYEKSNGSLWITDNLNLRAWNGWAPIIKIEAESNQNLIVGSQYDAVYDNVTNVSQNEDVKGSVSGHRYAIISNAAGTPPVFDVYLPNVVSTEYAIYAVMVPSNIKSASGSEEEVLPYALLPQISYHDANGKLNGTSRYTAKEGWTRSLEYLQDETGKNYTVNTGLKVSEAGKIDTLFLGYQKFPMCYYGLDSYATGNICRPSLHIQTRSQARISTGSGNVRVECDPTIRIDCILLVPRELQDYLKAHPDYMAKERPEYQYFATH